MYRYPHILNNAHHLLTNNVQVKSVKSGSESGDDDNDEQHSVKSKEGAALEETGTVAPDIKSPRESPVIGGQNVNTTQGTLGMYE